MFRRILRRLKNIQRRLEAKEISFGSFYLRSIIYSILIFNGVTLPVTKIFWTDKNGESVLELHGALQIHYTFVGSGILFSVILIGVFIAMTLKHGERFH